MDTKKVATVRKELKTRPVTHYHVRVGGHPLRTFADEALAQHFAIDHKAFLVRQGCDVESKEFHVEVEEETKEQQYSETVEA